jgi:hypothetical protein
MSFTRASRRVAQVVLTLVGAIALHGAATATANSTPAASASAAAAGFQDPSKNIQCAVKGSSLTCMIRRQDKASCAKLFTASGTLKKRGPSVMNFGCFKASPLNTKRFKRLAYGKRKRIKGITCVVSKRAGIKCTNADKHGFTLSRKGSTSF